MKQYKPLLLQYVFYSTIFCCSFEKIYFDCWNQKAWICCDQRGDKGWTIVMKARLKGEYSRPPGETLLTGKEEWVSQQEHRAVKGKEMKCLANTVTSGQKPKKSTQKLRHNWHNLPKLWKTSSKRPKPTESIFIHRMLINQRTKTVPIQPNPRAIKSGKRPDVSEARMRFEA